jgi:hypothetical protein
MNVVVIRRGEEWVVEVDGSAVTAHGTEAEAHETAARLAGRRDPYDDDGGDGEET